MASPESVRRHNLSLLLRLLHQSGALSRSEIGAALGMTRSTIGELVADLRARGLVEEGDPARLGAPGRPSLVARPNPEGAAVITAEIAVNSLSAAVVGLGGRILHLVRVPHQPRRLAADQTVEDVGALIAAAKAAIPSGCWVAGLGVAVAGVVSRADGLVHFAPNLGWRDVPLGHRIAEQLGYSLPVVIANEADLGALAEHTWGAGVGVDHLIYVSSEVGVGAGLIIDGRPLVGAAGCAGEVGHVQVNPVGVRCRCGAIGCWETEIGGPALLRRAGRMEKTYRPELVTRLLREAAWGDPVALGAVEDVGRWLGSGLAGLVNAFNPQRVVVGGLLGDMWPLVEQIVQAELRGRVMAPALDVVDIRAAHLGADGPLLGAAELALARVLDEPTLVPARTPERRSA
ncbi:MAG TPA: ROK family transcriptional regulator [Candidatus Acidoferrales bacterium]|nr:ROK family transcriptional regulator [Candidatus Acidoferrales bacterium]